jgi:hypothetical protein
MGLRVLRSTAREGAAVRSDRHVRAEWATAMLVGVMVPACAASSHDGTLGAHHPVPVEDGERVLAYDVAVLEDDTRCSAKIPYKHSEEELLVEWHSPNQITMYMRGGIYQVEVTLDENGAYAYDGAQGRCLPGSSVWGRIDRESGETQAWCHKLDCDVYFTSTATRRVDGGTPGQ